MLKKLATLLVLMTSFVILSCESCATKPPEYHGEFWAGWPDTASIVRTQEDKEIRCDDPIFREFTCFTYDDLELFYETYVQGCAVWKKDVDPLREKLKDCPVINRKNLEMLGKCLSR